LPEATGPHVPTLPRLSQASHEFVHARLQHTPSGEQMVLVHSPPEPHIDPFDFFGEHLPLLQC
jgi:hypothetical protein